VRAFANNISNQITDFIMYMTSAVRQQSVPPSGYVAETLHTMFSESNTSRRPPNKRRKLHEQDSNLSDVPESAAEADAALKSRLHNLRKEVKGHGHRSKTPGMPSLWGGDETDSFATHRRRRQAFSRDTRTRSPDTALGSGFRHESISDIRPKARERMHEDDASDHDESSGYDSEDGYVPPRIPNRRESGTTKRDGSAAPTAHSGKVKAARAVRRFTTKDDVLMIDLYYKGLSFRGIAKHFPEHSHNQIRYHFHEKLICEGELYKPRPGIFTPPGSPPRSVSEPADESSGPMDVVIDRELPVKDPLTSIADSSLSLPTPVPLAPAAIPPPRSTPNLEEQLKKKRKRGPYKNDRAKSVAFADMTDEPDTSRNVKTRLDSAAGAELPKRGNQQSTPTKQRTDRYETTTSISPSQRYGAPTTSPSLPYYMNAIPQAFGSSSATCIVNRPDTTRKNGYNADDGSEPVQFLKESLAQSISTGTMKPSLPMPKIGGFGPRR
jgi:hypothetical protein